MSATLPIRSNLVARSGAILAIALAPLAASAVVVSFDSSDQGWIPAQEFGPDDDLMFWSSNAGPGGEGAWVANGHVQTIQTLTSPTFRVLANGSISVTIDHRYDFLDVSDIDEAIDGGNLRYSVNGGAWTDVVKESFEFGGYHPDPSGIEGLEFGGFSIDGWSATSPGYAVPEYTSSRATFGSFVAGDFIQVQFRAGWTDGPSPDPNWVIGRVELDNLAAVPEPAGLTLAAGALALGVVLWRRSSRRVA